MPRLYDDENTEFTATEERPIAPKSRRTPKWPGLMSLGGESAGKVFRLEGTRIVVGRTREAHVQVTENGVSRRHCLLVQNEDGSYRVEDLGSTNGTMVNGERVAVSPLDAGDRLQLGPELVLQFSWFDEAEQELANRLVEAARFDALTGALNRRSYDERLAAEVAYALRHREKLSVIAFDIDHFKSVNDRHGHVAGDAVLKGVAAIVRLAIRTEDVFARVGGEEFIVLGRGLSTAGACALAERLREAVQAGRFEHGSDVVQVTISLGVGELAEAPGSAIEKLLEMVDDRLYVAKNAGRNRVVSTG
jgi:diguanylate cyclase (GGDEF)-like protein